jgi:hypothetical protein
LEGLYELRDGQLIVAYGVDGGARPKNFAAESGASSLVVTYRRK